MISHVWQLSRNPVCITELPHLYTLLIKSKPALSKAENAPKCSHLSNVSERKRHRTKLFTCRSIKTFFVPNTWNVPVSQYSAHHGCNRWVFTSFRRPPMQCCCNVGEQVSMETLYKQLFRERPLPCTQWKRTLPHRHIKTLHIIATSSSQGTQPSTYNR